MLLVNRTGSYRVIPFTWLFDLKSLELYIFSPDPNNRFSPKSFQIAGFSSCRVWMCSLPH